MAFTSGTVDQMRRLLLATTLVLLAACGGDDDEPTLGDTDAPACEELYADGADVDEAVNDDTGCIAEDGDLTMMGTASYDCTDGRTLYYNDEGWGYSGDTWHRYPANADELVAPEDERTACEG